MNKYDFIQNVLENKDLSIAQRERLILLIKEEIKNDSLIGGDLEKRIKGIEEVIFESKNNDNDIDKGNLIVTFDDVINDIFNRPNWPPEYLFPINVYKYLYIYNQNDILKATCHDMDSTDIDNVISFSKTNQYIFEEHLELIISEFMKLDELIAPYRIKASIYYYLTGKRYSAYKTKSDWESLSVNLNWSMPELKEWALLNKGIPPNPDRGLKNSLKNPGYEFDESKLLNEDFIIQNFNDVVKCFKHLFHIRKGNSFFEIVNLINDQNKYAEKIDFIINKSSFQNNIEMFTDVNRFKLGYKIIVDLILENKALHNAKEIVELKLIQKKDKILFSILHLNSTYNKTLQDLKHRPGKQYRNLIKEVVNGICNLYLIADFEDATYNIKIWANYGIWNKKHSNNIVKLENRINGVEHVFEFIKNK